MHKTYNKGEADEQVSRSAILEMNGPIVCCGDAIVDQAVYGLYNDAVYQEANELECGNRGGCGVRDRADVGGSESTGFDEN